MLGFVARLFGSVLRGASKTPPPTFDTADETWLVINPVRTNNLAASEALRVWAALSMQGALTPEAPWVFILDPGADEEYEWVVAGSLEELWTSVETVESPMFDGWVAVVGPARKGVSQTSSPPRMSHEVLFGVALTSTGDTGYATCKIPTSANYSHEAFANSIECMNDFVCNMDITRWLSTVAGIRKT